MASVDAKYCKEYREKIGFTNQNGVKAFFAAKDIVPAVDYEYIGLLNARLVELVEKMNSLVTDQIKIGNVSTFCKENIQDVFEKLKENNIIPKLNNQGRRPEKVYFSWMCGFVISSYFMKALSQIFKVEIEKIDLIGDDDLSNIETFKRTPKADLEVNLKNGEKIRIEVQSGFQGVNDIKQHKVLEAIKTKKEKDIASLVVHFDLFNGQVAFVRIDNIDIESVKWIKREQMEGQLVFGIEQKHFVWKLSENPPKFAEMSLL